MDRKGTSMRMFVGLSVVGIVLALSFLYFRPPTEMLRESQSSPEEHSDPENFSPINELSPFTADEDSIDAIPDDPNSPPNKSAPSLTFVSSEQLLTWSRGDVFEGNFSSQPIDPTWAPETTARIYDGLATVDLPIIGVEANCRTTICRIEVLVDISELEDGEDSYFVSIMDAIKPVSRTNERLDSASGANFGNRDGPFTAGDDVRVWLAYFYGRDSIPVEPFP
jgi:hypothetical protein